MLRTRLMLGALLVAGVLVLFYLDGWVAAMELGGAWARWLGEQAPPGLVMLAASAVLIPLAAAELAALARAKGMNAPAWLTAPFAFAIAAVIYAGTEAAGPLLATITLTALLAGLVWHGRKGDPGGGIADLAAAALIVVYLGMGVGVYLAMRWHHAPWVILAAILIIKCGDIGAYFTGRAIGRTKLIPWLSPKKTWEGLAGGIVLAVLAAVGFAVISQQIDVAVIYRPVDGGIEPVVQRYAIGWAAAAGLVLVIAGHLGDLTVSLLKRDAAVKDSGWLLPGFGGVLDVLDSPLLAGPAAYWLLRAAAEGGG